MHSLFPTQRCACCRKLFWSGVPHPVLVVTYENVGTRYEGKALNLALWRPGSVRQCSDKCVSR